MSGPPAAHVSRVSRAPYAPHVSCARHVVPASGPVTAPQDPAP